MKKYLFIFAAAAAVLAGCSKGFETEDPSIKDGKTVEETTEVPDGSFLCSFAMNGEDETKTTISASDDKNWYLIKWEKEDTISVTRTGGGAKDTTATFTAQSDGAEVLFRNKDVTGFFKDGATYTATFGKKKSSSYAVSNGRATHIYMTATCYEPHRKFVFHTESNTAFLAVQIPDGVSAKGLKVMNDKEAVATLKSSGEAIKAFYVPVAAGDHKFQIEAYEDTACSTIIAESMKMYSEQTMIADKIYPFTFTPTLKVTEKGKHSLQSYPADYKVWICTANQKSGLSLTDIADSITVQYLDGAANHPANVYVDAKGSTVAKLVINTTGSHVNIENGNSVEVISKTSKNTLVVKPTYTITKSATVQAGSITVEGNAGKKNVDTVILAYPNKEAMAGVVVSVTKVTVNNPVLIKNKTKDTQSTPITVVGFNNSDSVVVDRGGFRIENGKTQNIIAYEKAVAKIGDTVYERLDSAILKVKAGETITLIDDCETGSDYNLEKHALALTQPNVTLDLNGYKITETNNFSFVIAGDNDVVKNGKIYSAYNKDKKTQYHSYALVIGAIADDSKVTGVQIENVEFQGGISVGGSKSGSDSQCHGSGEATIKGCTVTSGDCYIICSQIASPGSSVTVLSGTYNTVEGKSYSDPFWADTNCAVLLKGGTYNSDPTAWVADGYEAVKSGSESAGYFWTVQPKQNVAKIGNTKYATLAEAVEAAKDGDIITMLEDHCISSQIEIADKEITLELDGYTVSCSTVVSGGILAVHNGAGLTVSDGKGTGKVEGGKSYAGISVTVKGDSSDEFAKLTVNGGTIEGFYYGIVGNGSRPNTQITINGGTVKGTNTSDSEGIYHPQNGTLTITGGTVEGYSGVYMKSGSAATLTGGTINGTGKKRAYKSISSGCEATGDAIIIDNCGYPGGAPYVTVSGTTLSSTNACQVGAYYGNGLTDISDIYSTDNTLTVPESYIWQDNGEGKYKLVKTVAKIGNTKYATLAEAVAAVPTDGTPTTIEMINDAPNNDEGVIIAGNQNVILDLAGHTVSQVYNSASTSYLIENNGTLTINDSKGNGKLTACSNKPDEKEVPGYASNTITNYGTLIVNAGTIENTSAPGAAACYSIDNTNSKGNASLFVHGGSITRACSQAMRMVCFSKDNENNLTMDGGSIIGVSSGFWLQLPGKTESEAPKANIKISGGTITGNVFSFYDYSYGQSLSNVNIEISGGNFNGEVFTYGSNINVTGGNFHDLVEIKQENLSNISVSGGYFDNDLYCYSTDARAFISGGLFKNDTDCKWPGQIVSGFIKSANTDSATKDAYPWTVKELPTVAKIGDKEYKDLGDAIADVPTTGVETTVEIAGDLGSETEWKEYARTFGYTLAPGQNLKLDLKGHKIYAKTTVNGETAFLRVENGATLTIADSSTDGAIYYKDANDNTGGFVVCSAGKLNVTGGLLENKTTCVNSAIQGAVDVHANEWGAAYYTADTEFTMTGGVLRSVNDNTLRLYDSSQTGSGKVNISADISGGEIYGADAVFVMAQWAKNYCIKDDIYMNNISVKVSGGKFDTKNGIRVTGNVGESNNKEYKAIDIDVTGGTFIITDTEKYRENKVAFQETDGWTSTETSTANLRSYTDVTWTAQ